MAGGLQPPWLGRNLLRLGNFPERTIGNSGKTSLTALHVTLFSRAKIVQPPEFEALLSLCVVIYKNGNFDE